MTLSPGNVNAVVGASNAFTVTLTDLFRRAFANQTVTATVTGKNPTAAAMTAVTNAAGQATFTVTDLNTNTAVSDTLTVTSGSSATATIAYGTNAVGTVTLEYPNEDDVVAGTTFTEISAAGAGATGTSAAVTAIVTGSSGALLAGVPVTFAVSGLTGAEVHTTLVTVYTNTSGGPPQQSPHMQQARQLSPQQRAALAQLLTFTLSRPEQVRLAPLQQLFQETLLPQLLRIVMATPLKV